MECSIHQGNKKLNSLFLPLVTPLPNPVKISTCIYINTVEFEPPLGWPMMLVIVIRTLSL
jgi:hypothetical protein